MDGLLGVHPTVLVVADDAAQKAVVRSADVVVVVEQDGGQRRNINVELLLLRNLCRQLRIEGMDAFEHQYLIVAQL